MKGLLSDLSADMLAAVAIVKSAVQNTVLNQIEGTRYVYWAPLKYTVTEQFMFR